MARQAGINPARRPLNSRITVAATAVPIWISGLEKKRVVRHISAACHRIVHHIEQEYPHAKPDQPGKGCQQQALTHDLRYNIERLRTNRTAHSDLACPLPNCHHHNITNPNNTSQQSSDTDKPNQNINTGEQHIECFELFGYRKAADSMFVRRGNFVLRTQDRLYVFHHLITGITVVGRRTEEPELVSLVGSLLERLKRDHYAFLRTPANLGTGLRLDHTDYLVIDAIHPYVLSDRIFIRGKKDFAHDITDQAHLTLFDHVDFI